MYLSRNGKCICLKLLNVFVLNCKIILSQRSGRRDCGRQRPCQGLPGHLDIVSDNLSLSLYLFISRNMGWRHEILITSSFVWNTQNQIEIQITIWLWWYVYMSLWPPQQWSQWTRERRRSHLWAEMKRAASPWSPCTGGKRKVFGSRSSQQFDHSPNRSGSNKPPPESWM